MTQISPPVVTPQPCPHCHCYPAHGVNCPTLRGGGPGAPQPVVGAHILAFAYDMQRELDANARKGPPGSWAHCEPESLWNDVMYHAAKMIYAMKHGDAEKVQEFAADVANMAMMTRDAWMARQKIAEAKE